MTEVTAKYPHLAEGYKEVADLDIEKRIAFIRRERYLQFEHSEALLRKMELLFEDEDRDRPNGMLIAGESLMGKTSILKQFQRRHRASDNPDGDHAIIPVVYVQFPERASADLYKEILRVLNASPPSWTGSFPRGECVVKLKEVGMRVLVVDEVNNLMVGTEDERKAALNSIKYLMNETMRPVVAGGTGEALRTVKSSTQMVSRLRTNVLQPFVLDEAFLSVLVIFESTIPLQEPSNLHDIEIAEKILTMTGGVMGQISDLLAEAAQDALLNGKECITLDSLNALVWAPVRGDDD